MSAAQLIVRCMDSDLNGDDLIGEFEIDLGQVWSRPSHEMYRQWVGITDTSGEYEGIQGYLKLSASIVPAGEALLSEHADFVDDDELSNVLMPPSIEMVGMELYINCHKAEGLPKMDLGGA